MITYQVARSLVVSYTSSWLEARYCLRANNESLKAPNAVLLIAYAYRPLTPGAVGEEAAHHYRIGPSFQDVQLEYETMIVRPAALLQQCQLIPRKN